MTQEEIKLKSTEELKQLLKEYKEIETQSDLNQYVRKILINACYGAIGNKHFPLYNPDIADAITSFGRYSIQTMTSHVVDNINKQLPFVKLKRSLNDTDSVVGGTLINSKKHGEITIEDYYNSVAGVIEVRGPDNYIKHAINVDNVLSMSDSENVEYKQVRYIMKHKVKKRMYKITVGDKAVEVTEDHSIIIKRDNKIQSIKPKEIIQTDKIITIIK